MKVFEKSSRRKLRQIFPCSAVEIDFRLGRLNTQCRHSLIELWPRASLGHLPETLVRLQRRYYLSPSGMLQRKSYSALTSTWGKEEGMSYAVFEKYQNNLEGVLPLWASWRRHCFSTPACFRYEVFSRLDCFIACLWITQFGESLMDAREKPWEEIIQVGLMR